MEKVMLLCILTFTAGMVTAQTRPVPMPATHQDADCRDAASLAAAQRIIDTWIDGYNSGDPDRVADLYTPDAYYLTQHYITGIIHGRARIRAYVKLGVDARYHIDSIRIVHVTCAGDFIAVITRYQSTNAGKKDFGVNLVVARKTAQGWRIVAHEAAVPDPATAVQHLDVPAAR